MARPGGPAVIRLPPGEIDLRVTDERGEPLDFVAGVGGRLARGRAGSLRLRGVEPGPRVLVVGSAAHGGRVVDVDVPDKGAARVEIALPRR